MRYILLITLILITVAAWTVDAAVIYVKTTGNDVNSGTSWSVAKKTITAGISGAVSGDQVWVAAGTYTERVTLKDGVALYGGFPNIGGVWSVRNRDTYTTEIDGSQLGSVVISPYDAGPGTVIDGFTIKNGRSDVGGGIYCYNSSPVINNNRIKLNTAAGYNGYGGGICCERSSPTITNNIIETNSAKSGGGIYVASDSHPTISNNTLSANTGTKGGGIYCADYSSPTITGNGITGTGSAIFCEWYADPSIGNNTLSGNTATSGGGIYCAQSSPAITANTINSNISSVNGGGLYLEQSSPQVQGNMFYNNRGVWGGAVCSAYSSSPVFMNNILSYNTSTSGGGGIYCSSSSPAIINNTLVGNTGASFGGAMSFFNSQAVATNNLVSFNNLGLYRSPTSSLQPSLMNNCIYGNNLYNYYAITAGPGDISTDPLLVNRYSSNYHLTPRSPCINKGNNSSVFLPSSDFDGASRIWAGTIDIGAYEYHADPVPVKDVKQQTDGTWVGVQNSIISAIFSGFFYIESDDRINGIRINGAAGSLSEGTEVEITGKTATSAEGERYIEAATISKITQ